MSRQSSSPQVESDGRVFLSYSTTDKTLAGQIKEELSALGFSVFLAHEDLTPSQEWQKTILSELRKCDVFIALITENFRESDWTDQEAGYALAHTPDCLILPLLLSPIPSPHGFLKTFQALPVTANNLKRACLEAMKVIDENRGVSQVRKDRAITKFTKSNSFREAKTNARALTHLEPFSKKQIERILIAATANDQIYLVPELRPLLKKLAAGYGHLAPEIRDQFLKFFTSTSS